MALVFAVFTACDSGSSSTDPDPIAEVSSSSGDDEVFSSSSVTDKGTSSGGSSKSSSSVKSFSSSSNNGQNASSSSSRYKTCTSEKEGIEAYISQEQSWCICTDGFFGKFISFYEISRKYGWNFKKSHYFASLCKFLMYI